MPRKRRYSQRASLSQIQQQMNMYAPDEGLAWEPEFMKDTPRTVRTAQEGHLKAKPKREEDQLQIACVKLLRTLPNTLVWSNPNHLYLGKSQSDSHHWAKINYIHKQKAMGMLAGASDLNILFRNIHGVMTLCLAELKIRKNKLQNDQKTFSEKANSLGAFTGEIRSLDDLTSMLKVAAHPNFIS